MVNMYLFIKTTEFKHFIIKIFTVSSPDHFEKRIILVDLKDNSQNLVQSVVRIGKCCFPGYLGKLENTTVKVLIN